MPDYITGQNFDFKFRKVASGVRGVNNLTHNLHQKKKVTPLPTSAVTKARTNAKRLRLPTKKTTSEEYRRQTPQEYKTFENLESTYQSTLDNIRSTMQSDEFIKIGMPTSQYDKNRLLINQDPILTGAPVTSATFLELDNPIQIATYIPEVINDTNLNLKPNFKKHPFKSTFHDYFNDLLVWYNDTLNKNVENIWDPVKGLRENIGVIPEKLAGITKEVDLMNQYLSSFEVLRTGEFVFNRGRK